MIPISGIVNASLVSSASDPPLSSDSILIKWRPVTAAAGIGSWDNGGGNHTIIMTPGGGGVLVSWLVSLLSEEIMGFILQGLFVSSPFLFPSPPVSYSDPISSTYLIHFIEYSPSSRRLLSPSSHSSGSRSDGHRSLSISDPGISVSISPDKISSRAIREYVPQVSDKRFYLLSSGLLR
jgi:hypothetical protein